MRLHQEILFSSNMLKIYRFRGKTRGSIPPMLHYIVNEAKYPVVKSQEEKNDL